MNPFSLYFSFFISFLSGSRLITFFLLPFFYSSVFLRILEYYSGVLFLTTNRVGTLDEAFKSRIHMSLYYPPLNLTQTEAIFKLNIEQLGRIEAESPRDESSTADSPVDPTDQRELRIDHDKILAFAKWHFLSNGQESGGAWNGRQIRNAFQIAASLAHYDDIQALKKWKDGGRVGQEPVALLDHTYFETVSSATVEFERYMAETRGGTDTDLSHRENTRADGYTPKSRTGTGLSRAGTGFGPSRQQALQNQQSQFSLDWDYARSVGRNPESFSQDRSVQRRRFSQAESGGGGGDELPKLDPSQFGPPSGAADYGGAAQQQLPYHHHHHHQAQPPPPSGPSRYPDPGPSYAQGYTNAPSYYQQPQQQQQQPYGQPPSQPPQPQGRGQTPLRTGYTEPAYAPGPPGHGSTASWSSLNHVAAKTQQQQQQHPHHQYTNSQGYDRATPDPQYVQSVVDGVATPSPRARGPPVPVSGAPPPAPVDNYGLGAAAPPVAGGAYSPANGRGDPQRYYTPPGSEEPRYTQSPAYGGPCN